MRSMIRERGSVVEKKEITIENYIEIDGEDIRLDTLPEHERAQIAEILQDTAMSYARIRRARPPV